MVDGLGSPGGLGTDGTLSAVELTPGFVAKFRDYVRERRERGIAAPNEFEPASA